MKKTILLLCCLLVFAGCANNVAKLNETSSGNPEAFFPNTTKKEITEKIIAKCAENDWLVSSVKANTILCVSNLASFSGKGMLTQLTYGSGSTVKYNINFILYSVDNGTKVSVQGQQEIKQSSDKKIVKKLDTNEHFNKMQQILNEIGEQ